MQHVDVIGEVLQRAVTCWPGVTYSAEEFEGAIRLSSELESRLDQHGTELYLAFACLAGDPVAIDLFDNMFLRRVARFVSRVSRDPDFVDEVTQQLRVRLFTGNPPKLAQYRGEGPLEGWVRVVAMRAALNLMKAGRQARYGTNDEHGWSQVVTTFMAPDHRCAVAELQPAVQDALTTALEELPARSKALLRLHFVERLNIEEVGILYKVHRSTVARWLATVRDQLSSRVEEILSVRLRVTPSECRSLIDLVREDLHASLSRILPAIPIESARIVKIP
jgi:RNA polymerase sigma-70 factor, ECF subfamily